MNIYFSSETWVRGLVFYLRTAVFVLEQGIDPEDEFDKLDTMNRSYLLLTKGKVPIATARYQQDDTITLHPDRLCVAKEYRGQGFGTQILLELEKQGKLQGCMCSVLSAEVEAQYFYEKLGYTVTSDEFLEDGIRCVKMKKFFFK